MDFRNVNQPTLRSSVSEVFLAGERQGQRFHRRIHAARQHLFARALQIRGKRIGRLRADPLNGPRQKALGSIPRHKCVIVTAHQRQQV